MATRKIVGTLLGQDGLPLPGKRITVTLIDSSRNPTSAWVVSDSKRVIPQRQVVTTDAITAEFELILTPNDILSPDTQYKIEVGILDVNPIISTLPSGDFSDMDWYDFYSQGYTLTPLELTDFQLALESREPIITSQRLRDYFLNLGVCPVELYGGLVAACSNSNTAGKELTISTNQTLTANFTTDRAITVKPSGLITSNYSVTINGPFASSGQAFAGSGSVIFGSGVSQVIPQWWGAKGDGTTDDTAAMLAAFKSLRNAYGPSGFYNSANDGPKTVFLRRGHYPVSQPLPIFLGVDVVGENGGQHPTALIVQMDISKPLFILMPQAYNASWVNYAGHFGSNTIRNITTASVAGADQVSVHAPVFAMYSVKQSTAYCNANYGASGGSTTVVGGFSDLIFQNVTSVDTAGPFITIDEANAAFTMRECELDNSAQGINVSGTATGGMRIEDCYFWTLRKGAIWSGPSSGNGFDVKIIDSEIMNCAYVGGGATERYNLWVQNPTAPTSSISLGVSLENVTIEGFDNGGFWYGGGLSFSYLGALNISNSKIINLKPINAKYLSSADVKNININNSMFTSGAWADAATAEFVELYNDTDVPNPVVKIDNNTFNNESGATFLRVLDDNTVYANKQGSFSNNSIYGAYSSILSAAPQFYMNSFGNTGSGFPRINYQGAVPSFGAWQVGDTVINTIPVELGTTPNKYIIEKWKCVTAGSPGAWVQVRTLTGN